MAKPGQSSFRRILLSRILLLSVPILLMGVYFTYKRAESSLQETARQNLTESAIKKGASIHSAIAALQANLVTASETVTLKSASVQMKQKFLTELARQFGQVQCVQLTDINSKNIVASTCGNQPINQLNRRLKVHQWSPTENLVALNPARVAVTLLPGMGSASPSQSNSNRQLRLIFTVPVYDLQGQLRYVLSLQSALLELEKPKPGSLAGYTVVIDENGTILAHPETERVGGTIEEEEDKDRLKSLIKNAIAGQQKFLHLFSFGKNGLELLAGYTAINSPITTDGNRKWVILAVQSRDYALSDLRELWLVLFTLTLGLIIASILASAYLARELARPVEKLRDYALHQQELHSNIPFPDNFKIREFNQLAEAIRNMVERLKSWAEELENAWKEAQNTNQLKSEFLANTSHELRTPLNIIISCIRLIRDGLCDNREEELEFLVNADDAAIHLLAIIEDMLDIAKIESGKLSLVIEPINFSKLLKDAIALQSVPIQQKGLRLQVPELVEPITVEADASKLRQVLINVLGNATKFTPEGSITVSIRIEDLVNSDRLSSSGKWVIVTVKDTGIGIAPAEQQKLFRPFVMVDGSTTREYGGTGLGLAISRNLMALMGGTITLHSDGKGCGTAVEVSLPVIDKAYCISSPSTFRDEH
jgi:two-component system, NarL family, sensor histidine kinase BarA